MVTELPDVDLTNHTAIVTGANSGIGFEITRNLVRMNARVVMACRSQERGEAARHDIREETGRKTPGLMIVDLADQTSIRSFCERFYDRHDHLHILVNNAGIWPAERQVGPDGIERTWATNVMGYFLLTEWLLPLLKRSTPARIVNVASKMAGRLDLEDLQFERRPFKGRHAYAQSKQANRMLTWLRAEELRDTGVTANAVHPGGVNTNITRYQTGLWGLIMRLVFAAVGHTPEEGADTPTWVASAPELEGVTGTFWADRNEAPKQFTDLEAARELRRRCERIIQVEPPDLDVEDPVTS